MIGALPKNETGPAGFQPAGPVSFGLCFSTSFAQSFSSSTMLMSS